MNNIQVDAFMPCVIASVKTNNRMQICSYFNYSITANIMKIFEYLLPHVPRWPLKNYLLLAVDYNRLEMLIRICHRELYDYTILKNAFRNAVCQDRVEILRWMLQNLSYRYPCERLGKYIRNPNMEMVKLLEEYNLMYLGTPYSSNIKEAMNIGWGKGVYPMTPENHNKKTIEFLIYMHDKYPNTIYEEVWECKRGEKCYICSLKDKTDIIVNSWYIVNDINNMIQWLPAEIVDDITSMIV